MFMQFIKCASIKLKPQNRQHKLLQILVIPLWFINLFSNIKLLIIRVLIVDMCCIYRLLLVQFSAPAVLLPPVMTMFIQSAICSAIIIMATWFKLALI